MPLRRAAAMKATESSTAARLSANASSVMINAAKSFMRIHGKRVY
jgi:hypothetical protein